MSETDTRLLGLFGGSFDPVHVGHLRLAIEAKEYLGLEELRLLPVTQSNLRQPPRCDAAQRVAMLREATQGMPGLVVDTSEIDRAGVSYTVDTLNDFRARYPRRPLVFILGMDAFAQLPKWHQWQKILALTHLLVVTRPDQAPLPAGEEMRELLDRVRVDDARQLVGTPAGSIAILTIPPLPISSSDIRARIRQRRDIRFLVPDTVREIIEKNGLYQ
ncbi:MAG: nicotinate-nucleotide adenylyltransferase [Gammaproteobacteria bacterium]|nr:nicotinate-nucleotide adenylyltransferase [Gammaproteobacteria bacterium]